MSSCQQLYVGTAGWTIPALYKEAFPSTGSHLSRYGHVLNAVEINSTFYKLPRQSTIERWIGEVPPALRYSLKTPKEITHEKRLSGVEVSWMNFIDTLHAFQEKLGCVLVQLPPSLDYSIEAVNTLEYFRAHHPGSIVLEPRHASWTSVEAEGILRQLQIGRVAADPACHPSLAEPGGDLSLVYFRLHGSPRKYWSAYPIDQLEQWGGQALDAHSRGIPVWVVFDNTARGAATMDALTFMQEIVPQELQCRTGWQSN